METSPEIFFSYQRDQRRPFSWTLFSYQKFINLYDRILKMQALISLNEKAPYDTIVYFVSHASVTIDHIYATLWDNAASILHSVVTKT